MTSTPVAHARGHRFRSRGVTMPPLAAGIVLAGLYLYSASAATDGTLRVSVVEGGSPTPVRVRITDAALWEGIAALASARRVGEIGAAIEDLVAMEAGETLSHLEGFGGHGIGTAMHQPPDVMNYRTRSRGAKVVPGLCLAIEPMLIQGSGEWEMDDDDWTVRATGGGRAAHAEHSVAVTEQGLIVLTEADGGAARLAAAGITAAPDPAA